MSPWRAVDSPQEADPLETPSAAWQAMHSLEAELGVRSRLLPPQRMALRMGPLSAADIADLTRGIPALRLNPLSAAADFAELARGVPASRRMGFC